jgi:hypothetical protein
MLGELIGESRGKRSARRVVSAEGGCFKVEVSFEDKGTMLGGEANGIGTYTSGPGPDGTLSGEGHGVLLTPDGGVATWKGTGVGKFLAGGAVSYRGALFYSTATPKLARLNSIAAVFEFEVDAEGNTHSKLWEWK